jgi:hypothetical protein
MLRIGIASWYSGYCPQPLARPLFNELSALLLTRTTQLQHTTDLGYAMFRCKECYRTFNEPTGTPFKFVEVPTDIVFQVLLC